MNLQRICNEKVTIERTDGTRRENVPALVQDKMIMIADETIPIQAGDTVLRQLPSGLVERMVVTDPGFHAKLRGMPGHYQAKYRKEGAQPAGQPGYVVHVTGDNSRVNIGSIDASHNTIVNSAIDIDKLADELGTLRDALLPVASDPQHYIAIGHISSAQLSAKSGDVSKASAALSALGSAGKWAWDMANKIGAGVAADAIKTQLGL